MVPDVDIESKINVASCCLLTLASYCWSTHETSQGSSVEFCVRNCT